MTSQMVESVDGLDGAMGCALELSGRRASVNRETSQRARPLEVELPNLAGAEHGIFESTAQSELPRMRWPSPPRPATASRPCWRRSRTGSAG